MMHLADFNLRRAADVEGARAKIHECMLLLTGDRQRASQAASAFSEVARALVGSDTVRVEVSIGRIGESRALQCIMVTEHQPPAQLGASAVSVTRMALPPERAAGRILGDSAAAVPELVKLLQTEAKVL